MKPKRCLVVIALYLLLMLACNLLARTQPAPGAPETAKGITIPAPSSSEGQLSTGSGQTYYVAPNGDNTNPGTRVQPWADPGYASRQLRPGDTLIILGGRYTLAEYDADILTPPSGESNAWITIQGEEGNRPILVGRDNLMTAINLAGVSYVNIQDLEITHDDQARGEST